MLVESERIQFLNEITSRILGNENPGNTTETILETLKTHLNAYGGVLYFLDENQKHLITYAYTKSTAVKIALKVLGRDPFSYKFLLENKDMLLIKCLQNNIACCSKQLADFFVPVISAYPLQMIQKMLKIQCGIAVPIYSKVKVPGVLFVAFQKPNLTKYERAMIQFYANLAGIAIDNRHKYDQLEKEYQQEKTTTTLLSHELKTPIAIAHSASQLLRMYIRKKEKKLGSATSRHLLHFQQQVDDSVFRLNYICESIFRLMDSENKDTRYIHVLDLDHHLEQVFENYLRKSEKKGLKFEYRMNITEGVFYGGGVQFEQILTVLLDNAVKYTQKGSIQVHITMDGTTLRCTVRDTGPGIPVSKRKAVFDRFYRHKTLANRNLRGTPGLGLGLYVARKIVHNLHGTIRVSHAAPGRGSQFFVELPVYTKEVATSMQSGRG